jgi:hypothetical protein
LKQVVLANDGMANDDIWWPFPSRLSVLQIAVLDNDEDFVRYLVQQGADIHKTVGQFGWHVMHFVQTASMARTLGELGTTKEMLADINGSTKCRRSPLWTMIEHEVSIDVFRCALDMGISPMVDGGESMIVACAMHRLDVIQLLLARGYCWESAEGTWWSGYNQESTVRLAVREVLMCRPTSIDAETMTALVRLLLSYCDQMIDDSLPEPWNRKWHWGAELEKKHQKCSLAVDCATNLTWLLYGLNPRVPDKVVTLLVERAGNCGVLNNIICPQVMNQSQLAADDSVPAERLWLYQMSEGICQALCKLGTGPWQGIINETNNDGYNHFITITDCLLDGMGKESAEYAAHITRFLHQLFVSFHGIKLVGEGEYNDVNTLLSRVCQVPLRINDDGSPTVQEQGILHLMAVLLMMGETPNACLKDGLPVISYCARIGALHRINILLNCSWSSSGEAFLSFDLFRKKSPFSGNMDIAKYRATRHQWLERKDLGVPTAEQWVTRFFDDNGEVRHLNRSDILTVNIFPQTVPGYYRDHYTSVLYEACNFNNNTGGDGFANKALEAVTRKQILEQLYAHHSSGFSTYDSGKGTALHLACSGLHQELVEVLVRNGESVESKRWGSCSGEWKYITPAQDAMEAARLADDEVMGVPWLFEQYGDWDASYNAATNILRMLEGAPTRKGPCWV